MFLSKTKDAKTYCFCWLFWKWITFFLKADFVVMISFEKEGCSLSKLPAKTAKGKKSMSQLPVVKNHKCYSFFFIYLFLIKEDMRMQKIFFYCISRPFFFLPWPFFFFFFTNKKAYKKLSKILKKMWKKTLMRSNPVFKCYMHLSISYFGYHKHFTSSLFKLTCFVDQLKKSL